MQRPPTKNPLPLILGLLGLAVAIIGFVIVVTFLRIRDAVREFESAASGPGDFFTHSPSAYVQPKRPRWIKDVLAIDLVIAPASSETVPAGQQIYSTTLDGYFSDLKLPHSLPMIKPGKPHVLTVKYPGFSGRGGKYAKLKLELDGSTNSWDMAIPLRKRSD